MRIQAAPTQPPARIEEGVAAMSVDFKMPQTWQPETAPPETAPQETAPQEMPDLAAAPPAGAVSAGVPAPAAVPAAATPAAAAAWSLPARIAFRFAFCYLILYNFPFPLTWLPFNGLDGLFLGYFKLWDFIVLWTGKHVLHLGHEVALLRGKPAADPWDLRGRGVHPQRPDRAAAADRRQSLAAADGAVLVSPSTLALRAALAEVAAWCPLAR
jgi:hypothetical protein